MLRVWEENGSRLNWSSITIQWRHEASDRMNLQHIEITTTQGNEITHVHFFINPMIVAVVIKEKLWID